MREDWVEATITDLVDDNGVFSDGDWVESKDQDHNGDIRLIQLADIGDGIFVNKSNRFLTSQKAKELNCTFLKNGDLLIARLPYPLGRAVIFPFKEEKKYVTVVDVAIVRFGHENIIPKYYLYLINSPNIRRKIEELQSGTTRKRISRKNLSIIDFPLAPLPEQRAIVAKIEQLFSELDNAIANLETAKDKLEIYRQAVLKKAFEGELTKEWRENQENLPTAEELLKQIQEERQKHYESQLQKWEKAVEEWEANGKEGKKPSKPKKPKDNEPFSAVEISKLSKLPKLWKWVRINETVLDTNDDIVDGPFGSNLKISDFIEGGTIPVIGISNIDEGFKTKIRYVSQEKFDTISRSAVYPGNIIVAKIGSSYGKTGIYPEWMPVGLIPANLLRINPSSFYNRELMVHYLQSKIFKKRLDGIMKSTAQPAYNVSAFKDLPIPLLSMEEQFFLKQEIETRLSVCDNIQAGIDKDLEKAEALRQSILKKAFEGKLLSEEELEACRREPDWEPAEKLLERIKKSKEEDA